MPYKNKEDKRRADKRYREKHKEKIRIKAEKYYLENKEKIKIKNKKYCDKNRDKVRETNKKSYYKNKEKNITRQLNRYHEKKEEISEQRKIYRKNNKDKLRKRNKEYISRPEVMERRRLYDRSKKQRLKVNKRNRRRRQTDKDFAISTRLRRLVGLALARELRGGKNGTSRKYGIHYKKIIEQLKPFPEDLSLYEIDHIRPICSFTFTYDDGSTNFEEIKKAFAPENHQWLLAHENRKKSGKWDGEE